MAMAWVWSGMVAASVLYGILNDTIGAVGSAAMEGAAAAVELCLGMAGVMCLWSGVMSVMRACGLLDGLSRLFRPLLGRLLPNAARDPDTLAALSGNVSANLLGLGNAATPLGVKAARRMAAGCGGRATDELCRLVVLNTASIHGGRGTGGPGGGQPLRHSAGGMAGLRAVRHSRAAGRRNILQNMAGLRRAIWTTPHI